MQAVNESPRRKFARVLAWPMFCLAFLFLAIVATLIVLCIDVPAVIALRYETSEMSASMLDAHLAAEKTEAVQSARFAGKVCLAALAVMWPLFIAEFVVQFVLRDRKLLFWHQRYYGLIICLCPPLRLNARNHDLDDMMWLPGIGWQPVDDALRDRLERAFSIPMILIALAILPVLLVELGMSQLVLTRPWLQLVLHISMGVIWFAFAIEFIIMVSVAEEKIQYCKEHWLDLLIILLPLVSFLRSLRVVRATRLARVAKVQQLAKMGRLYRLRGLALKAFRAILLFGLLNRLLHITPEKRLRHMRLQLAEKEAEIATLQGTIVELEEQIRKAHEEGA